MLKNKKALFVLGALIVVFIVVMIVISLVVSRPLPFNQIENVMYRAAISYYHNNLEEFEEITPGTIVTLSTSHLDNYMKPLDSMLEQGVHCDGVVRVSIVNESIAFFPFLDCGDDYYTKSLSNYIKNNEEIVEEGPGLYEDNNTYIYRGSRVDNWVEFNDRFWRILEIDENNQIKMVESATRRRTIWDSRLNPERDGRPGVNEFRDIQTEHSDIRYFLDDLVASEDYLSPEHWGYLSYMDLCIGKRSLEDTSISGATECDELFEDQLIGLLSVYEFMRVSLDDDCRVATDIYCENFNYLTNLPASWLLTGVEESTHEVFYITPRRVVTSRASRSLRTVTMITLNPYVAVSEGDGSAENPYVIN